MVIPLASPPLSLSHHHSLLIAFHPLLGFAGNDLKHDMSLTQRETERERERERETERGVRPQSAQVKPNVDRLKHKGASVPSTMLIYCLEGHWRGRER